ncbi:MAG: hypothetical protein DFNUSKGM_001020 [Candidatus Fervidibacter sacchari]
MFVRMLVKKLLEGRAPTRPKMRELGVRGSCRANNGSEWRVANGE